MKNKWSDIGRLFVMIAQGVKILFDAIRGH
jgi:hypothetical protein